MTKKSNRLKIDRMFDFELECLFAQVVASSMQS